MKLNKKIKIGIFIFLILTFTIGIKSFANNYKCNLELNSETNKLRKNESISISLYVSNINAGNGVAILNSVLDYDSNIFEIDIEEDENGNWMGNRIENVVTFVKKDYEPTRQNQEIAKIIVTAKETAPLGNYNIELKDNELSDTESFMTENIGINIQIVEEKEEFKNESDELIEQVNEIDDELIEENIEEENADDILLKDIDDDFEEEYTNNTIQGIFNNIKSLFSTDKGSYTWKIAIIVVAVILIVALCFTVYIFIHKKKK